MWSNPPYSKNVVMKVCHYFFKLLCLRETHNTLQLPVFFYFGEFGAKKYFTVYRRTNIIQGFRDLFPVRKMYGCYQDMQKFPAVSLPCYSNNRKRLATVCRCKQPTSNRFHKSLYCVYLLKLCNKSNMIFLTNDLTNIYSEISITRLIL